MAPTSLILSRLPLLLPAGILLYLVRNSLPFAWHLRVLVPYHWARWRASASKASPATSIGTPALLLEALPIGKDPFEVTCTKSFHASIDDCDFMGHMSNSCYPKNLDIVRLRFAVQCLLQLTMDGGWIALGSISFKFVREIGALSHYQIRSGLYAWDDKWLCEWRRERSNLV
jgi:hypothetical protein